MRLHVLVVVALLGCGKRATPPPPPPPVAPPPTATPHGVVGCNDSYVAIPNEAKTDFVVVQVDHQRFGSHIRFPLSGDVNGLNVTLEIFEKPVTGAAYCTDYGDEPQRPEHYVAVSGRIEVIRKGDLVTATVTNPRFVDARGRIVDIARRECANVKVGWSPG